MVSGEAMGFRMGTRLGLYVGNPSQAIAPSKFMKFLKFNIEICILGLKCAVWGFSHEGITTNVFIGFA